uniref:MADS-box domain-containing protein n=1 Tax=Percolomonas cosmopolitus TaxID=63605 RepID=A0A7S1PHC2_9EUKA|mmetsp:Transcript_1378/g.4746  ORF Transcript_1378/g.4746 Transcript_1378/m.4746 type:complete len:405 (+) Transcript_1378:65-1279(+)|eukprot:CAMPEP_0117449838 /NCGR_PEP_ID=MMETSP0759-20121206/8152_1 /TAXON_ID=63605 /ORGANISM="Percolomonas cosmopolitus, Strain WS" /LENGTH=404 /DNA_ID=CAMNT_0005242327 /DNA_START=33 /DNA_END=1247 /DNA_ORIENTATION=+
MTVTASRRKTIEYQNNPKKRFACFSKRKFGFFKKSDSICKLTGCQVTVLMKTESGNLFHYASNDNGEILLEKLVEEFSADSSNDYFLKKGGKSTLNERRSPMDHFAEKHKKELKRTDKRQRTQSSNTWSASVALQDEGQNLNDHLLSERRQMNFMECDFPSMPPRMERQEQTAASSDSQNDHEPSQSPTDASHNLQFGHQTFSGYGHLIPMTNMQLQPYFQNGATVAPQYFIDPPKQNEEPYHQDLESGEDVPGGAGTKRKRNPSDHSRPSRKSSGQVPPKEHLLPQQSQYLLQHQQFPAYGMGNGFEMSGMFPMIPSWNHYIQQSAQVTTPSLSGMPNHSGAQLPMAGGAPFMFDSFNNQMAAIGTGGEVSQTTSGAVHQRSLMLPLCNPFDVDESKSNLDFI